MQEGDIVKLKSNFEEELRKIGFCGMYVHFVSIGFEVGPLKISYIRHEDELNVDFAAFSPFMETPVQCLELANGKDILRGYRMKKRESRRLFKRG